MKRLNSNDIAKLAGVSRSTVSRVVNGYSNVPPETRERVMKVIKENHYYPLLSGQLLNGKATKTLGLFWIGRANIAHSALTSRYFMSIIDAAANCGYLVLSCILDNLTEKRHINYVRKIFMEGRIDAGIFVGVSNDEPLIDELLDLGKIVGIFDYYHENEIVPGRITVNFDRSTAERTIDYLYSLGHRKIAIIDGDLSRLSCMHRHEGYVRGISKNNLSLRNQWMTFGGITRETGYPAALQMLSGCMNDLPTAICANNDGVAFAAYQACQELGLRIPEDISIIGADGEPSGEHSSPPLTTFAFDFQKMFASLVQRVVDTVEQKEDVPPDEFIEGELIVRGSCGPVS